MASKPNIRSIRFSDELAELIDRQVGNSFTEKFENLIQFLISLSTASPNAYTFVQITRCVWEQPQKEAELEQLEKKLRQLSLASCSGV